MLILFPITLKTIIPKERYPRTQGVNPWSLGIEFFFQLKLFFQVLTHVRIPNYDRLFKIHQKYLFFRKSK